jgi:hypothetical protein
MYVNLFTCHEDVCQVIRLSRRCVSTYSPITKMYAKLFADHDHVCQVIACPVARMYARLLTYQQDACKVMPDYWECSDYL